MSKNGNAGDGEAAELLLRELRSRENRRFLRALPGFEAEANLPPAFGDLLQRLDEAEQGGKRKARRGPGDAHP